MPEFIVPLVFMGVIAGFVTLGVGLNILTKWAQHRMTNTGDVAERFAGVEDRIAELEERVDFAERALSEVKSRRQLESGGA